MDNEFDWIRSIQPKTHKQKTVEVGIGDDAAIVRPNDGCDTVLAVDTMVEGVHFTKDTMTAEDIGYKALAVNLSDIAAMGAVPLYYIVSIAVPKTGWSQDETRGIYRGMAELAEIHEIDLIGGDTVSINGPLVISVTIGGEVEEDCRLLRQNAQAGDIVFVTGPLGRSPYGLDHLLEYGRERADEMPAVYPYVEAHQRPVPQVAIGRFLACQDVRIALNDISDGIAHEAKEIAEASGAAVILEWESLPVDEKLKEAPLSKQEDWVLYGGEEFQLVGTVSVQDWFILKRKAKEHGFELTAVGEVTAGEGVFLRRNDTIEQISRSGYTHF
ncbi:thiamine-phosphate kinase [Salisediminibacterium halotolerans]|uniref:thiamine-phosphate kinase n=1 Tax=Salisediminibacterium halotolerans TaxID=517425 RepID=UPI000EB0067F|nr:thiamine-phosphate kinase [Salisediminibacterium halotolerans]RLJ71632.1 thiamine-phosphate kinase [Actinophytocola xinjiangensis]RPE86782.1 thiamine-phosphate kinase [Salisediminibacterium halotolerans]TWG32845.1 thiamine-phosphate kinase [Salisediminibacterium halotolerans]GEL09181.1 thiamine-monophosphate kinase [Salisediminibacterium halotolerans]